MHRLPKRTRRIALLLGLLSLTFFISYSIKSRTEPSYGGKSLSQWMLEYDSRSPPPEEARLAIRQIVWRTGPVQGFPVRAIRF